MLKLKPAVLALGALALFLGAGGCATKKYVRARVDPLDRRMGELESQSKRNTDAIGSLEDRLAETDRRAQSADQKAGVASQQASQAGEQAAEAARLANGARSFAEQGQAGLQANIDQLERRMHNMMNYELASTETVLFGFNSSRLSEQARTQLEAAARLPSGRSYVIEVQGFTDATGPADYNLELSRKRASSVVRYLTVTHKVPLHRVHVLGLGSETPTADNRTSEGRKLNRRVEVRFFAADLGASPKVQTATR